MQKRTFLKSALALGVALSAAPILTACSKAEPEKQAAAQNGRLKQRTKDGAAKALPRPL